MVEVAPGSGASTPLSGRGIYGYKQLSDFAFTPTGSILFAVDAETDQLLTIDLDTGSGTPIGPLGFFSVTGISFGNVSTDLYGVDDETDQLISIDPSTGSAAVIGPLGFDGPKGLTFDPDRNVLYTMDTVTQQLLQIDPLTGQATHTAPLGTQTLRGLAFDPGSNTLYLSNGSQLVTVVPDTGSQDVIGSFDIDGPDFPPRSGVGPLMFDSTSESLYAFASNARIVQIDTESASGTPICVTGFSIIDALAVDENTGTLYAPDSKSDFLIRIDPITGVGATVGRIGFVGMEGLAFNPNAGVLYGGGRDLSSGDTFLLQIDPQTAVATTLGNPGNGNYPGLAYDSISDILYGLWNNTLYEIDRSTGQGNLVGPLTSDPFLLLDGLSFDRTTESLFATSVNALDLDSQYLFRYDLPTQKGTLVGPTGFSQTKALAFNSNTGTLFGEDRSDVLLRIDTGSGAATSVGSTSPLFTSAGGLVVDPDTKEVYGLGPRSSLGIVDTSTGEFTFVAFMNAPLRSIAADPVSETIYGSDGRYLYILDLDTAEAELVGEFGLFNVSSLAFDMHTSTLFGLAITDNAIAVIDTDTGAASIASPIGPFNLASLAVDPRSGQLYGLDWDTRELLLVDPYTGDAKPVGTTDFDRLGSLVFVLGDCDSNGSPDTCDPDCDGNRVTDACQIAACPADNASCADCNNNGALDVCAADLLGDYTEDGLLDLDDHAPFTECLAGPAGLPLSDACRPLCLAAFDLDEDGDIDLKDAAALDLRRTN